MLGNMPSDQHMFRVLSPLVKGQTNPMVYASTEIRSGFSQYHLNSAVLDKEVGWKFEHMRFVRACLPGTLEAVRVQRWDPSLMGATMGAPK